jgi:hypothetical protein
MLAHKTIPAAAAVAVTFTALHALLGDFEGDVHDDVSELGPEACDGLVGWLDFYYKVRLLHWCVCVCLSLVQVNCAAWCLITVKAAAGA